MGMGMSLDQFVRYNWLDLSRNYNNQLIIWITTFNAESSITRSCYLRLTLYGYRETPFSNHFMKNHNAKSIKPNHHGNGNFNNYKCMDASKKENGEAIWLISTSPL